MCHLSCVMCHMSHVMCQVSPIISDLSPVTNANSLRPSEGRPPPANSPTMHSRLVIEDQKTQTNFKTSLHGWYC